MNFRSEEINRKLFSFYRIMPYLLKYIYFFSIYKIKVISELDLKKKADDLSMILIG